MKVSLQEPFSAYTIRKLGINERVKSFDCGDADLNDFILKESGLYREALLAVTYVFEAEDDENHEHIAAYFSLANDRVSITDFPNKTEFNRFRKHRFVNEKRLKSYPAAKICRLAVSQDLKGQHIGEFMIRAVKSFFLADNFLSEAEVRAADGGGRRGGNPPPLLRPQRHSRLGHTHNQVVAIYASPAFPWRTRSAHRQAEFFLSLHVLRAL